MAIKKNGKNNPRKGGDITYLEISQILGISISEVKRIERVALRKVKYILLRDYGLQNL
jgi:DNA-directed RNA polymerase specialized sigma24 family protein